MKGLYKKIGAIALAGMVVLGGGAGALGGVQKVDAIGLWASASQVPGAIDVKEFAKEYKFEILVYGSKERVDKYIEKQVKNKALKKRLKEVKEAKNKNELKQDIILMEKSGKKMHRLKYKGSEYLILFKK